MRECYCSNLVCYNVDTGDYFPLKCRSYTCPEHGKYNQAQLRKHFHEYFKTWDMIRFWTFTLSNKIGKDPAGHLKLLQEVWRYFITELRRNRVCNQQDKKTEYVKVVEPHKSGFFHFHVLFDRFVKRSKIVTLWEYAIETVTGVSGSSGGVHVKGFFCAQKAAYYVVKYVSKSSGHVPKGSRTWSKSNRIAIFPKRVKSGEYVIYDRRTGDWLGCHDPLPLLEASYTQLHVPLHQFALFPEYDTKEIQRNNERYLNYIVK